MKKVLSSIALTSLLFSSLFSVSASAAEQLGEGPLFSKEEVIKQMELEKEKQVQYHIDEYLGLDSQGRQSYLQEYNSDSELSARSFNISLNNVEESQLEQVFEEKIDNAYIYTMDDLGYIYDKEGDVVEKLDLDLTEDSVDNPTLVEQSAISPLAVPIDSTISGSNTGAFVRQTTNSGYKAIRTTFILPTDPYFEVPLATATGYLYNGLDVLSSAYPGTGFKIEAGLQYSENLDDYAASIRPLGSSQMFVPEGYTKAPPRYKAGTSIVSNLLYDTASSQVKYFVDGTNINGTSQYIYFYYSKSLSASELAALAVKRVTAIANEGWKGTNIGSVQVTYTSTTVTSNSGTTSNLTSSMLNAHKYNSKTHGTSDNPSTGITKSGNVDTQKIIINTTGF